MNVGERQLTNCISQYQRCPRLLKTEEGRLHMNTLRPPLHENFEMPTREEMLRIGPGDIVKLICDTGARVERMWVMVTNCPGMSEWHGVLLNEPFSTDGGEYGMALTFHPYDAIAIYSEGDETYHWTEDRFCGLN